MTSRNSYALCRKSLRRKVRRRLRMSTKAAPIVSLTVKIWKMRNSINCTNLLKPATTILRATPRVRSTGKRSQGKISSADNLSRSKSRKQPTRSKYRRSQLRPNICNPSRPYSYRPVPNACPSSKPKKQCYPPKTSRSKSDNY